DLLIAIWDGAPPELRGGTAQIVEEAQRVGIPVIWINPNDPQEAKVLIGFREDGLSLKDLGDYLRAQLVISDSRQARQLETYFSETRDRSPRTGLFTLFCHVVNLKVPNLQLKSSNHLERVKGRWRDSWIVPSGAVADPVVMGIISKLEEGVLPSYAWADNLANYYGAVFRSSFLFTYLLSPVAVLMALLSVLDKSSHRMVWAEMAIIFVIGAVTLWAAKRHWHQRWLEYRLLAEYLRQFRFLWLLGQKSPSSELPAHYGDDDPRNTWVAWLVHAVERNAGLADAQLCDDYLRKVKTILTTEVNTQIDYHEKKSHDYHVVHHRLHQIGFTLFFLTFLACIM
ncbi:MAG TPA: hypothetical protein PLX97_16680, partial [Gemmatales bacterium]|nr:hypothetical protein [Gemmatales bacterium]